MQQNRTKFYVAKPAPKRGPDDAIDELGVDLLQQPPLSEMAWSKNWANPQTLSKPLDD